LIEAIHLKRVWSDQERSVDRRSRDEAANLRQGSGVPSSIHRRQIHSHPAVVAISADDHLGSASRCAPPAPDVLGRIQPVRAGTIIDQPEIAVLPGIVEGRSTEGAVRCSLDGLHDRMMWIESRNWLTICQCYHVMRGEIPGIPVRI